MDRDTFAKLLIENNMQKAYDVKLIVYGWCDSDDIQLDRFLDDETETFYQGWLFGSTYSGRFGVREGIKKYKENVDVYTKNGSPPMGCRPQSHNIPPPPPPPPCTGVRDDKSWFPKKPEPIEMPIITR